MNSILSLTLFAGYASAQLTTTAWYVGGPDIPPFTLTGSVIALNSGRTTVAVTAAPESGMTSLSSRSSATMTFGGVTYGDFLVSVYAARTPSLSLLTVDMECSRTNTEDSANATCTFSTLGASSSLRADCSKYSRSEVLTPSSTLSQTQVSAGGVPSSNLPVLGRTSTVDYATANPPSYCTSGEIPEDVLRGTEIFPGGSSHIMTTIGLILTAGLEKLNATAAGSAAGSGASAAVTKTGASTAAAIPMRTAAPALVGMGAAMAAFFL